MTKTPAVDGGDLRGGERHYFDARIVAKTARETRNDSPHPKPRRNLKPRVITSWPRRDSTTRHHSTLAIDSRDIVLSLCQE